MSDLQIGLISLGVVIILLVLLFNWWQDRRVRQQMQAHFPEDENDPLMSHVASSTVRKEPTVRIADSLSDTESDTQDEHDEVDESCEAVIDIAFATPVLGRELAQVLHDHLRADAKPLRFFAITEDGMHRTQLNAEEKYSSMQLAVLLANRSGPITAIEWSRLWSAAQSVAQHFDAMVEGPEQNDVVQRAQQLDALCAELDAQVGLSLKLAGPISFKQVMAIVSEVGFLDYGRQTAWLAESGIPRFSVLFDGLLADEVQSASVERIDLLLDLPNSPADEQAFSRMACVGRDLALRLDAELLDDQGRPLPEGADQAIDEQLSTMYEQLAMAGFIAGEPRTARVFA